MANRVDSWGGRSFSAPQWTHVLHSLLRNRVTYTVLAAIVLIASIGWIVLRVRVLWSPVVHVPTAEEKAVALNFMMVAAGIMVVALNIFHGMFETLCRKVLVPAIEAYQNTYGQKVVAECFKLHEHLRACRELAAKLDRSIHDSEDSWRECHEKFLEEWEIVKSLYSKLEKVAKV